MVLENQTARSPEEALAGAIHELQFSLHATIPEEKMDELLVLKEDQSARVELPNGGWAIVTRDKAGYETETFGPEQEASAAE